MKKIGKFEAGGILGSILFAALLPVLIRANNYVISLLTLILLYIIMSCSLNLLVGYTGQMSMGVAAFFGIGAYVVAYFGTTLQLPLVLCIVLATVTAFGFGILLGVPSCKLNAIYLCFTTIAFTNIMRLVFTNWVEVTGGTNGFRGIRSFMIGGEKMTKLQLYYVVLVVTVLCVAILYRMIHSKTGRAFRAVKGNPIAAESMGINVNMYKMLSFATCGAFAGLAGAFYAIQVGYVSPEAFTTTMSIKILTMCVLGGLGNFYGAAVGAVIIGVGTELLAAFEDYQMIIYGLSIILILKFAPRGVAGGVQRLAEQIRGRASKAASGKEKGERV